jgi:hypothetical protein
MVPAPGLAACDAEWKLLCGAHNLFKLCAPQARPPAAIPGGGRSHRRERPQRTAYTAFGAMSCHLAGSTQLRGMGCSSVDGRGCEVGRTANKSV